MQHLWMLLEAVVVWPSSCNNVTPTGMRTSSIFKTQHIAARHNRVAKRVQHVVPNNVTICCVEVLRSFGRSLQCWSNNVGICCAEMLRSFGQGLKGHSQLAHMRIRYHS